MNISVLPIFEVIRKKLGFPITFSARGGLVPHPLMGGHEGGGIMPGPEFYKREMSGEISGGT